VFSGYRKANLRFAPAINFPASPFDRPSDLRRRPISGSAFQPKLPTLADCQTLRLAFRLPSNLRWRPNLQPAFQPAFDLRLRPTFQPSLCTDLQLALLADPQPAFQPTSSLRLRSVFQLNLPASLQLAPSICLPVPPSNPTSDSHRPADPFGAALQPTCSLRRRSTFRPCLTDQTYDSGCRISGSASRPISDSRLRPTFPPGL